MDMIEFSGRAPATLALAALLVAAVAAPAIAGPSFALSVFGPANVDEDKLEEAFLGFDEGEAPGLDAIRAVEAQGVSERALIRPFGVETLSSEPFHSAPINEFAGQRHRFEPGLLGEALGGVKRAFLNGGEEGR